MALHFRNFDKDANSETDNVEIQDNFASLKNGTENLKTNVQLSICTRIPKVILHRISPTSFKKRYLKKIISKFNKYFTI